MIPSGFITVSSRRVLLVENNPSDRQLLRNWLNAEAIETYEAVDIITALSNCQKYQPSLVLLQLRLNTWDGYEVIKRLKEDPRTRSIPVIFLASSALTHEKARGIDMGAVDFVSKPFDAVELLARVNSALRTKALLDLLEQRAHLDGLTELGNRFALQDTLPREFTATIEKGAPLSLLIADLDHFKKVNDQYGHAAGDEVLRRMAMILRETVRPTDFLARYGGEEFVVLCPDCDRHTASKTAERIREGVSDLKVMFRTSMVHVTSSVGFATVTAPYPADSQDLLERADQALYRAKSSGRNAVWYWDDKNAEPAPAANLSLPEPVLVSVTHPAQDTTEESPAAQRAATVTTASGLNLGTAIALDPPVPPIPDQADPFVNRREHAVRGTRSGVEAQDGEVEPQGPVFTPRGDNLESLPLVATHGTTHVGGVGDQNDSPELASAKDLPATDGVLVGVPGIGFDEDVFLGNPE